MGQNFPMDVPNADVEETKWMAASSFFKGGYVVSSILLKEGKKVFM